MVSSYCNLRHDTLQILSSVVKGLEVGIKYQSGFPRKQIQLILVLRNKQNETISCVSLGTCAHGKLKRHLGQIKGSYTTHSHLYFRYCDVSEKLELKTYSFKRI